jgi:uncharacterized protein (UPF0276 family)
MLGVGLQLNDTVLPMLERLPAQLFDFGELMVDGFAGPLDTGYLIDPYARPLFEQLVGRGTAVAHGNYGEDFGWRPLDETVCWRRHIPIAQRMKAHWYADHLFYGAQASSYMWSSPLQFSAVEAVRVADRAARIQDRLGMPLCHENAFYYAPFPGSHLAEAEFIAQVVERAKTYLLLDLHNVYANARNFEGYDVGQFLRTVPLDRVLEVHLAGGETFDGWYHDLHNHLVPEGVWQLLEEILPRLTSLRGVVLEVQKPAHNPLSRPVDDSWVPMIVNDLTRARKILSASTGVRR